MLWFETFLSAPVQSGLDLKEHCILVFLNDVFFCHLCEVVPPGGVAMRWTVARAEEAIERASAGVEVDDLGNRPRFVWGKAEVALLVT